MLKKLLSIFAFCIALTPLSFIAGCENWLRYEVWLCELEFWAGEPFTTNGPNIDGVFVLAPDENLAFTFIGSGGTQTCWIPTNPFVQTAYAFSPCADFQNVPLQPTFDLQLDRAIEFRNQTIPAGTNLLMEAEIAREVSIEVSFDCDFYLVQLRFSPASQNDLLFEEGEYEVSFACETDDERALSTSARVIFRQ
ncbi:MAG: hypothetical protein AAFQ68_27180 [Bacteroidota bacterium]